MTKDGTRQSRLGITGVTALIGEHFPQVDAPGKSFLSEEPAPGHGKSMLDHAGQLPCTGRNDVR